MAKIDGTSVVSGFVMLVRGLLLWVSVLLCAPATAQPGDARPFSFHDVATLDNMRDVIRGRLPVGTPRNGVRSLFVGAGATPMQHPTQPRVEKYIYDIDLCGYYVWRWNISADFDKAERTRQIYVNGEPALIGGSPARPFDAAKKKPGQKESISRVSRPRPQAFKGESSLAYLLYDRDSDPQTLDDQQLLGGGPTQADRLDMGRMHVYKVEPWRSIFDSDDAPRIASYRGDCAKVDAAMRQRIEAKPQN